MSFKVLVFTAMKTMVMVLSVFPRDPGSSVLENYAHISFYLASDENDGVLQWPALTSDRHCIGPRSQYQDKNVL